MEEIELKRFISVQNIFKSEQFLCSMHFPQLCEAPTCTLPVLITARGVSSLMILEHLKPCSLSFDRNSVTQGSWALEEGLEMPRGCG